jgi:hypothetical protein
MGRRCGCTGPCAIGYDRFVQLRLVALYAIAAGAAACATVWGFEDARDRPADGGGGADAPVAAGEVIDSNVPGIVCAPRPPEAWQGPLAMFTATASPLPALPTCLDRWELAYDGVADHKTNSGCGCECDPTTTQPCAKPILNFFEDSTCTMPCGTANQEVPSIAPACVAFDKTGCGALYAKITTAAPQGSCTAKSKGPPVAVTWGAEVRLCQPKAELVAECPADKKLAPASSLPFEPGNYCIVSRTATECPTTYPRKRTFFDADKVNDTRSCKPCSCGAPTGTCGGAVVAGDDNDDCSGGVSTVTAPTNCGQVKSSNTGFRYEVRDGGGPVTCAASGGEMEGAFEPTAPVTVCCRK